MDEPKDVQSRFPMLYEAVQIPWASSISETSEFVSV